MFAPVVGKDERKVRNWFVAAGWVELFRSPTLGRRSPISSPSLHGRQYLCSAKQPSPTMSTDQNPPAETERTLDTPNFTSQAPVGCVECRTRRLHCETDPANPRQACGSCERNGYVCSNLTSKASAARPLRAAPRNRVEKRRITTACQWCRRQKIRCSGDLPCSACSIRKQSCVYPLATNRQAAQGESPATQGHWNSLPRYDVPGQDQMDISPSSNIRPGQIYQAPALARSAAYRSTVNDAQADH